MKKILLLLCILTFTLLAEPIKIIKKPIDFTQKRVEMTKEYIAQHYGKKVKDITIDPKIIVIHWTAEMSLEKSFARLKPDKLLSDRKDISKESQLNVSAHYLVDRDGTIYALMPDNSMARHVIGLNYSSIGIENVGGKDNKSDDLTKAQLQSNIALVKYLKTKYPNIEYMIGHLEYEQMKKTTLWLERDKGYITVKNDPGKRFMSDMRLALGKLHLKTAP